MFALGADVDVAAVADEVLGQGFEVLFDFKPGEGQEVVDFFEVADFAGDGGAEGFDAIVGLAGSFEDGGDVGIFLAQCFAVDV